MVKVVIKAKACELVEGLASSMWCKKILIKASSYIQKNVFELTPIELYVQRKLERKYPEIY